MVNSYPTDRPEGVIGEPLGKPLVIGHAQIVGPLTLPDRNPQGG